jgi:hypothetical protein
MSGPDCGKSSICIATVSKGAVANRRSIAKGRHGSNHHQALRPVNSTRNVHSFRYQAFPQVN